jgi:N-acetylglucosaminyl-diphospho-decaprenol L-rhamnosyltransferase
VALVDAVVVSYNSRDHLRACVEPLARLDWVAVVVVDNASPDASLDVVRDLPVRTIAGTDNVGFGRGSNAGTRLGSAPYVLFLNPDARIEGAALRKLVDFLERDESVGLVAPRIESEEGRLHHSLRRFPRLRSTYAQALFLHRLLPRAAWTDEVVRAADAYATEGDQEWVSGACMLVRRALLDQIGGFDERFFLYCEDMDLCLRIHTAARRVVYVPEAQATHVGGASAPAAAMLPVLASARVRYALKHRRGPQLLLERAGIALGAATHMLVSAGGGAARRGHRRALAAAVRPPARA